ncbi:DUF4406 domain-containing protein [Flavobacterium degerlachei]|jgi:nucleoside 2-deoxyribosyltransferase|uniref:DUF4406 domain-containing protein n=1 Tax=Flavobacterium degerlachei TaxID=229203 RepID=A0A1H2Z131_9FLAO|nr:DUF4406 domain-containing protein [Flavobacterium degerlachei]SDX10708.1 protein of unknown function [Flavobacterium degerlachei]
MKQKIYIAGKVTGLPPEEVAAKFATTCARVAMEGLEPISPIEVVNNPEAEWNSAMKQCLNALMKCDAVLAMPCYEQSRGAKVELWLSFNLSIPVFFELEELKQWNNSRQPTQ